ncbi:hypothetical protein CMV_024650 [Castanea mollissima]|uniref:Uncharacterized protein n=1 Tax=Castanea mollissima TaxID=60419 RepID=A0A8J4VHR7_9ROSI|nr:hypothetical protein CMV_024650 [Castanea mollissima]
MLKRPETNKKKMATSFCKKKLVEMKEKKDKSIPEEGGFISKRCRHEKKAKNRVIEKPEVVLQLAVPSSPHPRSLSLSLEVLPSSGGWKKKLVGDFWMDAYFVVDKAHKVISVDDLKALMSKPSNELMFSHIHRVMQVLGESLYLFGKYLDYEEKYVLAQSKVEGLF